MKGNALNSDHEIFLYERIKKALESCTNFEIHPAISLIDIVDLNKREIFTKEEIDFIMRPSRVDVAVTRGFAGRKITFAFESDSAYHSIQTQKKRDSLKDRVLQKAGIPLMRFRPEIHYAANKYDEIFIDSVLSSLAHQEFVQALGTQAYGDAFTSKGDHPVFLVLPYQKEFEELVGQAEGTAHMGGEELELSEEWARDDESSGVSYNRQVLLRMKGNERKILVASTGKCGEQDFTYGAYAAAERFAKMGCLYKYLVNNRIWRPEKRPFLNFIDDSKNRVPDDLLNPPIW